MGEVLGAQNASVGAERLRPGGVGGHLGEHRLHAPLDLGAHLVEEMLLVRHMPVERGGTHIEARRDGAERHGVDAALVEDGERCVHDALPRESLRHA